MSCVPHTFDTRLYLEGNQLSELPESIGDLAALQVCLSSE